MATAALLSGCATPLPSGSHTPTVAVPTAWNGDKASSTPTSESLAIWWRQFHDPVLDQLIADGLKGSPDVRTALSRIRESRARYGSARSDLWPSLNGSVSGNSSRNRNRSTDAVTQSESFSAGLDASWEVDLFGRQRLAAAAAAADLAETRENYYNTQASLAAEIATSYVTLRSAERQLEIVRGTLNSREDTQQIAAWREQAGLTGALDTQQAISSLEQARASVPALEQTVEQTRNQIALLLGRTPGALDALLAKSTGLPVAGTHVATGIPADTLRKRPDVRAAERALEAAAARTGSARRQRFPSLTLSGSIGVEALRAGKLLDPAATVATAAAGLTAPIFDAGKIRQTIAIQSELEEQAFVSYESTVLTALSEVENALVAIRRLQERGKSLDTAAVAAREAATLAQQQYEAGQTDLLTVLDAQRTQLSVEQSLVTARADLSTAVIQLYKALGGGWTQL